MGRDRERKGVKELEDTPASTGAHQMARWLMTRDTKPADPSMYVSMLGDYIDMCRDCGVTPHWVGFAASINVGMDNMARYPQTETETEEQAAAWVTAREKARQILASYTLGRAIDGNSVGSIYASKALYQLHDQGHLGHAGGGPQTITLSITYAPQGQGALEQAVVLDQSPVPTARALAQREKRKLT